MIIAVLRFKFKKECGSTIGSIYLVDKFYSMEMFTKENFKMAKEKAMVYFHISMEIFIKVIGQRAFRMDWEGSILPIANKN